MRTRFCATMRRPACSIKALIAPVRLRAVASGLMIEKVRSIAIGPALKREDGESRIAAAYNGGSGTRQGMPRTGDWIGDRHTFVNSAVSRAGFVRPAR